MAFEPPWILAPAFLECMVASGMGHEQATQTIREIIRSTRRMPPTAAPSPAEPPTVRYALPEIERLDYPLDAASLDIGSSTIHAVGKRFGVPYAQPEHIRARIEFWAVDAKRLFSAVNVTSPLTGGKRGRRQGYDWDVGETSIRKMLDERGDPTDPKNSAPGWNSKTSIAAALVECLTPRDGGDAPDIDTARPYARKILGKWQQDQSG